MIAAFVVLVLAQVMPPPLGTMTITLVLGTAYGTGERDLPVPRPQSAPGQEECNCGVPSSPRGPR
jgi:hypothetical protein